MQTWLEILEKIGDTPDNREDTLIVCLRACDSHPEEIFSEDTLPFLAHIREVDSRLWLAHVSPLLQFWPKDDRARFDRLLEECRPKAEQSQSIGFDDFSAEELRVKDVPKTKWIIKDILPEGLASLAGRPKQGKSWLALNLAIAVAQGGKALQLYEVSSPGSVLFLALEDNEARIKGRMGLLMRQVIPWPERLHFAVFSPRMGQGFIEALRAWLEAHPAPALVVVDMYTRIAARRSAKSSQSDYDEIYEELAPLQALAYEFHLCIMLVMHLNKTSDVEDATARIMGSTAFAGATVTNLILRRLRNAEAADALLTPNGKDIHEEDDIALIFENGIWVSRGNADLYNQTQQRMEVLDFLYAREGKAPTPKEIAEALGKNGGAIRRLLQKIREDGLVSKDPVGDTYHLTNAGAEVLNARTEDNKKTRNLDQFESGRGPGDAPPDWWDNVSPNDF
jgi:DNA-binding MarR family transcriptional regulator